MTFGVADFIRVPSPAASMIGSQGREVIWSSEPFEMLMFPIDERL